MMPASKEGLDGRSVHTSVTRSALLEAAAVRKRNCTESPVASSA